MSASIIAKQEFLERLEGYGFGITNLRRDIFLINNRFRIYLKYSKILENSGETWYRLYQNIIDEINNFDHTFVVFLIHNYIYAFLVPAEVINEIITHTHMKISDQTYSIHIRIQDYTVREGNIDLSDYLNKFDVFR